MAKQSSWPTSQSENREEQVTVATRVFCEKKKKKKKKRIIFLKKK